MHQSSGIVLHTLRYNDKYLIVDVYTKGYGTISFLVSATLKNGIRQKASLWQSLSIVDVSWEERAQRNLQKPSEWTLSHPWHSLPFHPVKAAMCLYLGEFLHHALKNEHANEALFLFLQEALTWFDEREEGFANFHVFLLLYLTTFLGFAPNVSDWKEGTYFDLQDAVFTSSMPLHSQYLPPAEAKLVAIFWRSNIKLLNQIQLNRSTRHRLLEVLTTYYQIHLPEFPATSSLDVLAEVFS